MQVQVEREIYIRASRAFSVISESIRTFQAFLEPQTASSSPDYYKARNLFKEGKAYYDQTIQDAKKLLGPVPIYAAKDFEKWRAEALVKNKIVVQGQTQDVLLEELVNDEFLKSLMGPAEIGAYLSANFETQRSGKRKIENIKVRMVIDHLAGLVRAGQDLQQKAQRKQQGLPI